MSNPLQLTPDDPAYEILAYIEQFKTLSATEAQAVLDSLSIKKFEKGDFLLRQGQFSELCFFILKGCVRQYYLVDGNEITTHFYTEGQPITPYEGTHKRTPSDYFLSAVEDTLATTSSPEKIQAFFQAYPQLEPISRMAVEEELGRSQHQLARFIIKKPEERYKHLMETRPDLLERVPQYQLASYLGIKPESLSRIRKRLTGKKDSRTRS